MFKYLKSFFKLLLICLFIEACHSTPNSIPTQRAPEEIPPQNNPNVKKKFR